MLRGEGLVRLTRAVVCLHAALRIHESSVRYCGHFTSCPSVDTAKSVACNIAKSVLDYCNSLLYATVSTIELADVVTQSGSRSSANPLLQQLHWLPVKKRINYNKLALLS